MTFARTTAGLMIGTALLAFPALAQTAQQQNAKTTLKDHVDKVVSAATGDPLKNADTDMKHVLDGMASLKPKPIEDLSPEEARQQPSAADGVKVVLQQEGKSTEPDPSVTAQDIQVQGGAGMIPARVYKPANATGPLPVIVYYHGGGFVIATHDTYDASARALAKLSDAVLVAVEYRKAPEARFPAQGEDAIAAYQWVLANAAQFGGDPSRVAVAGESAGGNLAINVSIAARDQKFQAPVHQLLVYPLAGVNLQTKSYIENADAKPLNKPMVEWFVKHTLKDTKDLQDPRVDIVGRADVRNLPATTLITAQIDPLRSEGQILAHKLREAGVPVDAKTYDGVTHEFFGMGAVVAKAKAAEELAANDLKEAFAHPAMGKMGAAKTDPMPANGPAPSANP